MKREGTCLVSEKNWKEVELDLVLLTSPFSINNCYYTNMKSKVRSIRAQVRSDFSFVCVSLLTLICLFAPGQHASGLNIETTPQRIAVTGVVTSSTDASPLIGVNILVKGSTIGTTTDIDGRYTIDTPTPNDTLVFSYIGYLTREVPVNGRSSIDIELELDQLQLDAVIVTGYATQRVRDLTGSVGIVPAEQIRELPVNGIEQAIQGRIAGVQVTTDGAPGGNTSVRVRGYSTIGNNDPLYIIDGIPSKSGINQINLTDVESIQVLKDAAATAIYGSRAANGVLIVTTKRGRDGTSQFSLDSYVGMQEATNLPTLLSAQEYGNLLWQAQINAGQTPTNLVYGSGATPVIPDFIDEAQTIPAGNTDWPNELFESAVVQSHTLGITSGDTNRKSYVSLSYLGQDGIIQNTNFERLGLRVNNELNIRDRLTIGENLSISYSEQVSVTNNRAIGGTVINAYLQPSIVPVLDVNGGFAGPVNGLGDASNPVASTFFNRDNISENFKIFGNAYADLELFEGFSIRTNLGLDYNTFDLKQFFPTFQTGILARTTSSLRQSNIRDLNWVWNNVATYDKQFDRHRITALVGTEAIQNELEQFQASREDFLIDDLDFRFLDSGQGQQTNTGFGSTWSLFSLFSRVNYAFSNKYLVSASIRRDGSSRFGSENRYGTFPAFSLGWLISDESFFPRNSFVDYLKLRGSWGQSGNQEIGDFASFTTFSTRSADTNYDISGSDNSVQPGFAIQQIGNADLKWETTTQTNFGLDATLLNSSLLLSVDYFIKNTDDILVQRPTLAVEGQANAPFINAGEIENTGIEIGATFFSQQYGDFSFEIGGNFTAIDNEVKSLSDEVVFLTGAVSNNDTRGLTISRTTAGLPIAQLYGHVADGIFQSQAEVDAHAEQTGAAVGRLRYRDLNGDNVIDDNDRQVIGDPHPDFMYGINLAASYKDFNLSLFFQGVSGVDLYNFTRYHTDFFFDPFNKHSRLLDAWTPENPGSSIPQVSTVNTNDELRPSTYFVEDGSYLRLKNIQFSYEVPLRSTRFNQMRIYLQAQNLFTITDYDGIDPEVSLINSSSDNRNLDIGVDRGVYPNARTFVLGVNVGF